MSQPYTGEIRMFAGNFAPEDWALCDGSKVAIKDYEVLYSLLGNTYGGDGVKDFALPDLRGRIPIGTGSGSDLSAYTLGQKVGQETVTLASSQIPPHQHPVSVTTAKASTPTPGTSVTYGEVHRNVDKNLLGLYSVAKGRPFQTMAPATVGSAGGNESHENFMSTLTVNFIICTAGLYPPKP